MDVDPGALDGPYQAMAAGTLRARLWGTRSQKTLTKVLTKFLWLTSVQLVFHEPFTRQKLLGLGLVLTGAIFVGLGS
jgi:hypothetical protein